MNQGTYPLAAAMINQLNRLDMISNNLSNLNTNGFKQESLAQGTFNHYLKKAEKNNIQTTKINTITNTIPKIDSKFISSKQGIVDITGNTLDFSLKNNNTFFKIKTKNDDITYTRDGAFKILNNFLVDSNGNYVLNNDNEAIVAQDDFVSQISIVKTNFKNLEKFQDNLYKTKDIKQIIQLEQNDGELLQGSIEKSNINAVLSMVSLIDAHRRFEQAQKGILSIDELNQKVIDKIGGNTR